MDIPNSSPVQRIKTQELPSRLTDLSQQPSPGGSGLPRDLLSMPGGQMSSYPLSSAGSGSTVSAQGNSDPLSGLLPDAGRTSSSPASGSDATPSRTLRPTPSSVSTIKKKKKKKRGKRRGSRPPIDGPKMDALEAKFGPWKGRGKNVNPRESTGPQGNKLLNGAYEALARGDYQTAGSLYEQAKKTGSPIMLDLDGDGKLGTTGVSTAKNRIDDQIGKTVSFDLDGDGRKENIEWMKGGDGMLVDDRDGGASAAMNGNGEIDGKRLFGDEGGKFGNGYDKLKQLDGDGDGKLTGAELEGLKVWVDNGDARVGSGELKSLSELGVTELSVQMQLQKNERGEDLMRSSFVQDGQTRTTEDVWFGIQS
jgi:hypothetical protein